MFGKQYFEDLCMNLIAEQTIQTVDPLSKICVIFEKDIFDFLFNKIMIRNTPRHHGFQSRKCAVLQFTGFLEIARVKNFYNLYTVYLDYV